MEPFTLPDCGIVIRRWRQPSPWQLIIEGQYPDELTAYAIRHAHQRNIALGRPPLLTDSERSSMTVEESDDQYVLRIRRALCAATLEPRLVETVAEAQALFRQGVDVHLIYELSVNDTLRYYDHVQGVGGALREPFPESEDTASIVAAQSGEQSGG